MKKLNNKGITVIEILLCFVLASLVTVTIFNIVDSFSKLKQREIAKNDITVQKTILSKVMTDDIVKLGLQNVTVNGLGASSAKATTYTPYTLGVAGSSNGFDAVTWSGGCDQTSETSKTCFYAKSATVIQVTFQFRTGAKRVLRILKQTNNLDLDNANKGTYHGDKYYMAYGELNTDNKTFKTNSVTSIDFESFGYFTKKKAGNNYKIYKTEIGNIFITKKNGILKLDVRFDNGDLAQEYGFFLVTPTSIDERGNIQKEQLNKYVMRQYFQNTSDDFHANSIKNEITQIIFSKGNNRTISGTPSKTWDVSLQQDGSIMAYQYGNKILIKTDNNSQQPIANPDSSYLFSYFPALQTVDLRDLKTSQVTNLSHMFEGCENLRTLTTDFTNSDYPNVWPTTVSKTLTDTSYMFAGCKNLQSLRFENSNFNTEQVTTMSHMFDGCEKLGKLWMEFNTLNLTDMSYLLNNGKSITYINFGSWNTSNVRNMKAAFRNNTIMTTAKLQGSFSVKNVTNIDEFFAGCSNLSKIIVIPSQFTFKSEVRGTDMFKGCTKLTNFNASQVDITKAKLTSNGGYLVDHE